MSELNVKVGDKGTYRGVGGGCCEVVFVKADDAYFVTSSDAFTLQVHDHDGKNCGPAHSANFDFIPTPALKRIAVWLNKEGEPHCTLRPEGEVGGRIFPEQYVHLQVPR